MRKHHRLYFHLLSVLMLLAACAPFHERDLEGQWRAVSISETGDSLPIDPTIVGFTFDSVGNYTFHSTLNYREAGFYHIDGIYLFTTDTTRPRQDEKAVEIRLLNPDSLILRMEQEGRERIVVLERR